jgi:plastocyanin
MKRLFYRHQVFAAVLLSLALAGVSGCKKSSTSPSYSSSNSTTQGNSGAVSIQNMAFSPSSITVAVNTTVTWTNNDNVTHTVTSNTGVFNSGNIGNAGNYGGGGTFSYKFTSAGTFPYHCSIHPAMTGTVVVQ